MSIQKSEFDAYAASGYTRIPLVREVLADLDTPLSTYIKLAGGEYSYLFESVSGSEKASRYSIIGLSARRMFRATGQQVEILEDGEIVESLTAADPLEAVREYQQRFKAPEIEGMPRFTGGLVGYFGYDIIRYIEPELGKNQHPDPLQSPDILLMVSDEILIFDKLKGRPDPLQSPDILLMVSDEILIFDKLKGRLFIVINVDPREDGAWESGQQRIEELIRLLDQPLSHQSKACASEVSEKDFHSGFSKQGYMDAVERAREYIRAGDIMQVVLSQRMTIPYDAEPLDLYRALRTLNPSPYMYFMNLGDFQVVGSSPEILVQVDEGKAIVRPIAGTRPRGKTETEDLQLEKDLLDDPKELAEHLMLVDLGRNDLGRIAEIGTVELTERMLIERYSHVMHIVSNVVCNIRQEFDAIDVLKATFPAGTVSGAPKIRAMEIIDELEPVKRGVYSGAVGYLGWNGNMDTAIAIRTSVIKDGMLNIQVGAGIVADSQPEMEWEETLNKGRATFRAVAMAAGGFRQLS
jgi:anthranilate synthase component 1